MRKAKADALQEYEAKQKEIRKLLKQIEVGLEKHDREASMDGEHNCGHVGDLESIAETLTDFFNSSIPCIFSIDVQSFNILFSIWREASLQTQGRFKIV